MFVCVAYFNYLSKFFLCFDKESHDMLNGFLFSYKEKKMSNLPLLPEKEKNKKDTNEQTKLVDVCKKLSNRAIMFYVSFTFLFFSLSQMIVFHFFVQSKY
jgi:hypothetical protein